MMIMVIVMLKCNATILSGTLWYNTNANGDDDDDDDTDYRDSNDEMKLLKCFILLQDLLIYQTTGCGHVTCYCKQSILVTYWVDTVSSC